MHDRMLMSITRISEEIGVYLSAKQSGAGEQIDPTALANVIVRSAVEQTCEIAGKLGIIRQIDIERGEFGLIVGVIARELFNLTEFLTDTKLSMADCTLDVGDTCVRAYLAMRR